MKNIKRLFILVISVIMVLSVAGCAFSVSTLPVSLKNGDSFNVKMKSDSQMLSLTYNKDDNNLLQLCDDEENELLVGAFLDEEIFKTYVEAIISSYKKSLSDIKILDKGKYKGVEYVIISFKNPSEEKTYEIIGWIVGSNTGILIDGFESETETMRMFKNLTFKISETEQSQSKYINNAINDLKNLAN